MATPAHSLPWMHPTTRTTVGREGAPTLTARSVRPRTECPIRARSDACGPAPIAGPSATVTASASPAGTRRAEPGANACWSGRKRTASSIELHLERAIEPLEAALPGGHRALVEISFGEGGRAAGSGGDVTESAGSWAVLRVVCRLVATLVMGLVAFAYLGGPTRLAPGSLAPTQARESSSQEARRTGDDPRSAAGVWGRGPPGRGWTLPGARYVAVGRIEIPRIRLNHAFFMGVHDDVVKLGPGLWPGTPLPGTPGNAVFAGHRTTHTHPFEHLDLLSRGDIVRTHLWARAATEFEVFRTTVVPEESYVDLVLEQPRPNVRMITLLACTPPGRRTHRIVVQARAQRVPKAARGSRRRDAMSASNQARWSTVRLEGVTKL
jgi:LPXTG-site transpeptidase (sortase) family protein